MEVAPGTSRATLAFAIDFFLRRDPIALAGIVTLWIDMAIPVIMVRVPANSKWVMQEIAWFNLLSCMYCCWSILSSPDSVKWSALYLGFTIVSLGFKLFVMAVHSVLMDTVVTVLMQGSNWGANIHQWWVDVMADYQRERDEMLHNNHR